MAMDDAFKWQLSNELYLHEYIHQVKFPIYISYGNYL